MSADFTAAWVPFAPTRDVATLAAVAVGWAEKRAAQRGLPAVLVTDQKEDLHGGALVDAYRDGRHATPRSPRLAVRPGAVIAYLPGPEALDLATELALGNALVVVEHPSPWRLTGWAGATAAVNLDTGETALSNPRLRAHLEQLALHGVNGYVSDFGRASARRVLAGMAADDLLDRDVVISSLAAYRICPAGLQVIAELIHQVLAGPAA